MPPGKAPQRRSRVAQVTARAKPPGRRHSPLRVWAIVAAVALPILWLVYVAAGNFAASEDSRRAAEFRARMERLDDKRDRWRAMGR